MKSKKLFKRFTAFVLTAVMSFSCVSSAVAETLSSTKTTEKLLYDWGYNFSSSGLPKAYDPILDSPSETSSSTYSENQFQYAYNNDFPYWIDEDGKNTYCVQLGAKHHDNVTQIELDLENNYSKYYSKEQANYIGYATIYGYKGKTHYGYKWDEELVATQCMIWCISARYFDSSTTNLSTNETKLLNCIKYMGSDSSRSVAHVKECFKKMKADILSHTTRPSGTGADEEKAKSYTLSYNATSKKWVATVSSNAVMKNFDIATKISGVTVTHSGNNLKFECTDAGAKKLVSMNYVTLVKTKATYSSSIDGCSPVFLSVNNGDTQAKISYFTKDDPVNAYVAFELSTGDLKVTKKISEDGEIKDVSGYSYEYFDSDLNTNVKLTWDKAYKWENQKWVEFKNAPTANPTFSAGLRNIIRFKVKNSAGQYVVATQNATGKYTFSKFDNGANATEMTLSYYGNGGVTKGTLNVLGLPTGTYTVEECYGTDGYGTLKGYGFTADSKTATVTVAKDKTATKTFTNKIATPDLTEIVIHKEFQLSDGSAVSDELFQTVAFKIYDETTKKYADLTLKNAETGTYTLTDFSKSDDTATLVKLGLTTQTATIQNLAFGNYTVYEIGSDNFIAEADKLNITTTSTGEQVVIFNNREKTGSAKVFKRTPEGKNITGITFMLWGTSDSGREIEMTAETDDEGYAFFENVPIGNYKVKEILSAEIEEIYYPEIEEIPVAIQFETLSEYEYQNVEKTGSIKVQKRTEGMLNIDGIGFTLSGTSTSGREINFYEKTDKNGELYFENIPVGTYIITEDGETVPYAYLVADEQTVTVEYNKTTEVEIYNTQKMGSIQVQKRTEGMLNIEGIGFTLSGTANTGEVIEQYGLTDKEGQLTFIVPIGTYIITEDGSTVPYAYLVADEQTVTVEYNKTTEVEIYNTQKMGSIQVQKRTEGMLNVEGIGFTLSGTANTGEVIEQYGKTDENGKLTFIVPIGTYIITEDGETVPYAYLTADPQEVTVKFNETAEVEIYNTQKMGSIQVQKRTEGMLNVEGIGFTLSGTANTGEVIEQYGKTDNDGKLTFIVPIGTYTITEDGSTVPYAYLTADPQEVTVEYNEEITAEIYNEEKKGSIQVQKTTSDMTHLDGIAFNLLGTSQSGRDIYAMGISNINGVVDFYLTDASYTPIVDENGNLIYDLPIGTYTIKEDGATVPTGYLTASAVDVTVDYATTTNQEIFNEKAETPPATGLFNTDNHNPIILVTTALLGGVCVILMKKKREKNF